MNYFDELKSKLDGMDEAKVNEIIDFSKKSIPKEFVPKDVYNGKVEELTSVNQKLDDTNKQIEDLKNSAGDVEAYKTKLEALNQEYGDYKKNADTRLSNIQKTSLLKDKLLAEGADKDNIDLLMKDFNIDEMQLKDEKIVGLDEYINPVKEKRARLFVKDNIQTRKPDEGNPAGNENGEFDNKLRAAMGLDPK